MGLYEFIALDTNTKATTVWNHATFLMSRTSVSGKVNLYSLEDFYVEVYYNQELNCIEDIRSFKSVSCLDAYLEIIELGDFLDRV